MLACSECGQDGACFCPVSDELDNTVDGRYHPLCYIRKGINISENLQHVRSHRSGGIPAQARASVQQLRLAIGHSKKPVSFAMRRL